MFAARFVSTNHTFNMLLTLSGILTSFVPRGPWCRRGSRLTGGLRSVWCRRRRLLLLSRRLRCWVGAVRRSSGHVFLRISPDANYHCHISATESAIKRNGRWCLWSFQEKKMTISKDRTVQSQNGARRLRWDTMEYNAINTFRIAGRWKRHPIRIRKYREASSKVNCSQPFRNLYFVGKPESKRVKCSLL